MRDLKYEDSYGRVKYLAHAEKDDHKYIRKEWKNGKWRYYYEDDSKKSKWKNPFKDLKKKADKFIDDAGDAIKEKGDKLVNKTIPGLLNESVNKVKEISNKIYDDPDNIYDINPMNYDEKIKKVAETEEWKNIVKNKDPEYVKKNADGSTTYLIDDYVAKKKQPVLDVIDDIFNDREISINKVEKDSVVAGVKQNIFGTIQLGMMAVGVVGKALIEKTKLLQGSYNDEIAELNKKVEEGAKYINDRYEIASTYANSDSVKNLANTIKNTSTTAPSKPIDEERVIAAAKVLIDSESAKASYAQTERDLTNLTEEEIALLGSLLAKTKRA